MRLLYKGSNKPVKEIDKITFLERNYFVAGWDNTTGMVYIYGEDSKPSETIGFKPEELGMFWNER